MIFDTLDELVAYVNNYTSGSGLYDLFDTQESRNELDAYVKAFKD